ncbi:hypothetical protein VNO77_03627 [Canavalia gladiata]|uniref:Uncharacterized protein n=1 Tax=Canavalia gladiata TaxID=3824 RepID=A0AAN9MVN6_CANGL
MREKWSSRNFGEPTYTRGTKGVAPRLLRDSGLFNDQTLQGNLSVKGEDTLDHWGSSGESLEGGFVRSLSHLRGFLESLLIILTSLSHLSERGWFPTPGGHEESLCRRCLCSYDTDFDEGLARLEELHEEDSVS